MRYLMSKAACIGLYGAIAGICMVSAPPVAAQDAVDMEQPCNLDLRIDDSVDWRGLYGRGYEVFGSGESFEPVSVAIVHEGRPCEFFLTAAPITGGENALTGPGDPLYYDLLMTTSGPSVISQEYFGTATSRIKGEFQHGRGSQSATLYVSIPGNQFVRGGTYDGQLILRLFRDGDEGPQLAAEAPLAILAPVASVLKIESPDFPQGTRQNNIDLGDLSREARRSVDFDIMSNADVGVTFQSANNGMLAHNAGAPGIKYQISFQGQDIDMSGSSSAGRINHAPTRTSRSIPIEIVVPAPSGLPAAGKYNDVLTVTFTAE